MKNYFRFIPAVYLVLIKDGSILLLQRHNTGYHDGDYSLVAGHLDGDESLTTAMVREAYEEAGIKINLADLRLVHIAHMRSEQPNNIEDERINLYFTTNLYAGTPYNREPDKCDDLRWFALDALPINMIPHVRAAINNIIANRLYSEHGWE